MMGSQGRRAASGTSICSRLTTCLLLIQFGFLGEICASDLVAGKQGSTRGISDFKDGVQGKDEDSVFAQVTNEKKAASGERQTQVGTEKDFALGSKVTSIQFEKGARRGGWKNGGEEEEERRKTREEEEEDGKEEKIEAGKRFSSIPPDDPRVLKTQMDLYHSENKLSKNEIPINTGTQSSGGASLEEEEEEGNQKQLSESLLDGRKSFTCRGNCSVEDNHKGFAQVVERFQEVHSTTITISSASNTTATVTVTAADDATEAAMTMEDSEIVLTVREENLASGSITTEALNVSRLEFVNITREENVTDPNLAREPNQYSARKVIEKSKPNQVVSTTSLSDLAPDAAHEVSTGLPSALLSPFSVMTAPAASLAAPTPAAAAAALDEEVVHFESGCPQGKTSGNHTEQREAVEAPQTKSIIEKLTGTSTSLPESINELMGTPQGTKSSNSSVNNSSGPRPGRVLIENEKTSKPEELPTLEAVNTSVSIKEKDVTKSNIDQVENKFHAVSGLKSVDSNRTKKPEDGGPAPEVDPAEKTTPLIGMINRRNGNLNQTVDIASITVEIINSTGNTSGMERKQDENKLDEDEKEKKKKEEDEDAADEDEEREAKETEREDEDDGDLILPRRRCSEERVIEVNWNVTDAGVLALRPCPLPYVGTAYRPCFSSGTWGKPDYTECRLPHLREIQNLIFYHVHKHLVDGLYPLAEELSRLVTSSRFSIKSPMDRLDAFDALNAILRSKIKIRLEDETKDVTLIRSLISTADQLLTKTQVSFAVEAEKNALITMKSAETIFGLRLLSENILRALIVFCNEGTIKRIKSIKPNAENIVLFLKHRTPFGALIPLLDPNGTARSNEDELDGPRVNVHLEEFKKLGVGLSVVWIKNIGSELNNRRYSLISDLVLVSVVPAVSIEVDFEEIPQIEIQLRVNKYLREEDVVKCGRMKTSRE